MTDADHAPESTSTAEKSTSTDSQTPPSMVERMTLILDAFGDRAVRLRLDEVVAHTGLPRSTSHRILEQLVRLEWLRHTSGGYALGQRALQLGGETGDYAALRAAAVPLLHDLHQQTRKVVHLGVLDFGDVVYLDKIGGAAAAALPSRVGGRVPAYATALGKAMLAWLTPEEADAVLEGQLKPHTRNTITNMGTMHEELRRIRGRRGLAFERDEYVQGVSCVGVAIRSPEGILGAISVCGETKGGSLERFAPLVADVAKRIALRVNPDVSPEDMPSTVWSDGLMERVLNMIDEDTLI